jgi:hypothetical protein
MTMPSLSPLERRARRMWMEIDPRDGTVRDARRIATEDTAELVRWVRFVDPGPDASEAQRLAAVRVVLELVDEPDDLHDAWTSSLRMLARGEITRSVVALLAEAMGAHEVAVSA